MLAFGNASKVQGVWSARQRLQGPGWSLLREQHLFACRHWVQLTKGRDTGPPGVGATRAIDLVAMPSRDGPVRVLPLAGPAMHLTPMFAQVRHALL